MITISNKNFQAAKILLDLADSDQTGHLQITSNTVCWEIYLSQGKIKYASHSLQSVNTIKYILLRHNFKETIKNILQQGQTILASHQPVLSTVNQLAEQNFLTNNQTKILHKELAQDAMEFCLWLKEGESHWNQDNESASVNNITASSDYLWDIPTLLNSIKIRTQAWQRFSPLVQSPLQRPICPNPSLLGNKVPSGNLSPELLEKLVKLMKGATIQDLSIALKQNDLRVVQLLFPYIKHQVIKLQSPKSPLDKLPLVPSKVSNSQFSSNTSPVKSESKKPVTNTSSIKPPTTTPKETPSQVEATNIKSVSPVQAKQKTYKIVSIDDSPTMLDMIKNYLGTDKYEVSTLENPMLSLGLMFDIKPDLVLMDFSMPGINGNKLCGILRKSPVFKKTPIIMVSGNLQMVDEDKLQSSGITDYLAKPFTREDLQNIVEKYLRD